MKNGVACWARRLGQVEAVILVNAYVQSRGNITTPFVIAGDPVRVARLDIPQEVPAHQIAAVIGLPKSFQLAVGERNRLEHLEQLGSNLTSSVHPDLNAG